MNVAIDMNRMRQKRSDDEFKFAHKTKIIWYILFWLNGRWFAPLEQSTKCLLCAMWWSTHCRFPSSLLFSSYEFACWALYSFVRFASNEVICSFVRMQIIHNKKHKTRRFGWNSVEMYRNAFLACVVWLFVLFCFIFAYSTWENAWVKYIADDWLGNAVLGRLSKVSQPWFIDDVVGILHRKHSIKLNYQRKCTTALRLLRSCDPANEHMSPRVDSTNLLCKKNQTNHGAEHVLPLTICRCENTHCKIKPLNIITGLIYLYCSFFLWRVLWSVDWIVAICSAIHNTNVLYIIRVYWMHNLRACKRETNSGCIDIN